VACKRHPVTTRSVPELGRRWRPSTFIRPIHGPQKQLSGPGRRSGIGDPIGGRP